MNSCFYAYKLTVYESQDDQFHNYCGMVTAENLAQAGQKITEIFEDDYVTITNIECWCIDLEGDPSFEVGADDEKFSNFTEMNKRLSDWYYEGIPNRRAE